MIGSCSRPLSPESPPASRPGPAAAGFTLVEALTALAVAALIAVLLLQAVRAAGFLSRLGAGIAVEADLDVVRDHLRAALARPRGRGADGRGPSFLGEPGRLVAILAASPATERGADMRMVLAGMPRADGRIDLVESRVPETAAEADPPEVLVGGAAALRLHYFGVAPTEMQPRWLDAWTRRDRMPALVEIVLDFPPGDPRRWAPLVVPLEPLP
ncbi:general secretion pathway protein J [Methylobacterium sp. 4-46]|uniref:general secretion pathway protein GspJ n=1 Tax=unclassified Methylobacterium TaxID=2615210 RepID=UPI000165CAA4|nr:MULTISPECIES: general secretion pathway protein GspJ [Methylobacterium]ACA16110.1 general secretion pathway protein J [Methylobacterium sp. 4-46]WFT81819.1 general secretion pathway protein GspJ [Methylobacterium nodulans]